MTTFSSQLAAALEHANNGLPVFPCDPATKKPMISKWPENATTDLQTIAEWWRKLPNAMIGIVTGPRSEILAIDSDVDHAKGLDGESALNALGELPDTPTVLTPRGGKHRYFRYNPDNPVHNSASALAPGVDIRGAGGYVIGAGSINAAGLIYKWERQFGSVDLAPVPDWLYDRIKKGNMEPAPLLAKINSDKHPSYFQSALRQETAHVASAAPGTRNNTLNKSSFSMGQIIHMAPDQTENAKRALRNAASQNGLVGEDGEQAVRKTIDSGFNSGQQNPRILQPREQIIIPTLTQVDIAREIVEANKNKLKYDQQSGKWYCWNGSIWMEDRERLTYNIIREKIEFTTATSKLSEQRAFRSHQTIMAVEKICANDPAFSVSTNYWDRDLHLLGTPKGTVDLSTGELIEPQPEFGITKTTLVGPDQNEHCPTWKQFLLEACGHNEELVEFLQIWFGICLTGSVKEQTLVFFYGPGGNGKSVCVNTIVRLIAEYARIASMDMFTVSQQRAHETEIARLCGARLVVANETEEGRSWAEAKIKTMTGGDRISARFMRQDHFEFVPQFKLVIVGNHQPNLRNVDDAIRRRLLIVPFTTRPKVPNPNLEAELTAEFPGILMWMINGALKWQLKGLPRPDCVLAATNDYFSEQDIFREWLDEKCECDTTSPYLWASVADLFNSWRTFAQEAAENPGTKKNLSSQLEKRGFRRKRLSGGLRAFEGLRLKKDGSNYSGGEEF